MKWTSVGVLPETTLVVYVPKEVLTALTPSECIEELLWKSPQTFDYYLTNVSSNVTSINRRNPMKEGRLEALGRFIKENKDLPNNVTVLPSAVENYRLKQTKQNKEKKQNDK